MPGQSLTEDLYDKLVNEEDARVCKAIDERACREVPGNFFKLIASQFFTKLGDALANPKIVLPWVMEVVQAPVYLLGFLVPIRESGSLLPQLMIASLVRRRAVRKWLWVFGSVLQALAIMGMGLVAWALNGAAAGWAIVGLLVVFSLSRGLCSVASKDVLGKTIPKTRRGQVNGWSASSSGLVTVGLAVVLILAQSAELTPVFFAWALIGAGFTWILGALIYASVIEFPGETSGGGNAIQEALERLAILRHDKPFRRFVVARSLLLCSALTAPYYVVLAQQRMGSDAYLLGLFLLASGLASMVSAPFWGRFADASSRRVMMTGAIMTAGLGLCVYLLDWWVPQWLELWFFLPLFYFALSIAHQGVRVGRKTYVVDLAEGERRTDYVAVSNTVIGAVLLLMGFTGWLASAFGVTTAIAALSLAGAAGAVVTRTLPEVQ